MKDHTAYHPAGLQIWDVWYARDGDTVHAYYLQKPAPDLDSSISRYDWIGHATSRDLVAWEEQPRALGPDADSDIDDLQPWTGSALWHSGVAYLYFTMRGSRAPAARVQRIGLATSRDGFRWERHEANPVLEADSSVYESDPSGVVDCRDLLVIRDPDSDGWLGFYAARIANASLSAGAAIAGAYSDDLVHWVHRGPVFTPGTYACLEVPDVFEVNGRWYLTCLVGNRYGNRLDLDGTRLTNGTIYAVADHPLGPFRELEGDRALLAGDVTCGYSCRTVELDDQRYLLYTEVTATGRDSISLPLEVHATPEGALRLHRSAKAEVLRSDAISIGGRLRQMQCTPHWPQHNGDWTVVDDGGVLRGEAGDGWHVAEDITPSGAESVTADAFEVTATFDPRSGSTFGFVLGSAGEVSASGTVLLGVDMRRRVAIAATLPDYLDMLERPLPNGVGGTIQLRVVARGERLQLYINDLLWIQLSRAWNANGRRGLGWYVENGAVVVRDINAWQLGD